MVTFIRFYATLRYRLVSEDLQSKEETIRDNMMIFKKLVQSIFVFLTANKSDCSLNKWTVLLLNGC